MISLFGYVAELGVGGVERSAFARAFQRTKKHWISSSGSKVMIVQSCWCALGFLVRVQRFLVMVFHNINFSDKWKFPSRKLLKIGRSVVGESIYNLVETNYVFIEQFMHYVRFCGDNFFWFAHT